MPSGQLCPLHTLPSRLSLLSGPLETHGDLEGLIQRGSVVSLEGRMEARLGNSTVGPLRTQLVPCLVLLSGGRALGSWHQALTEPAAHSGEGVTLREGFPLTVVLPREGCCDPRAQQLGRGASTTRLLQRPGLPWSLGLRSSAELGGSGD